MKHGITWLVVAFLWVCQSASRNAQGQETFPDEPAAHALYDRMVQAMRTAERCLSKAITAGKLMVAKSDMRSTASG